ncbi:MAG: hypothetical protein P8177_13615 [Gemmatimonadota bacterium]
MTRNAVLTGGVLLLVALSAHDGAAQDPAPPTDPGCETGEIRHIFIDNHSIFDTSDPDLDPRFRWAYSLANKLHRRTKDEVIRRELLFDVGDCLDPLLLEESERLLRGYNFIARVDVYAVQQPEGGYHVLVDTEDEWSTQVELKFDLSGQFEFEQLQIRERNLLGTGQSVGAFFRSDDATRTYAVRYETPQFLKTRWDLELAAGRTRTGNLLHQELRYPFVGEIGRYAMREWYHLEDQYFEYIVPFEDRTCLAGCRVLVPTSQRSAHVAGLRRFGRIGNFTVIGAGLSYQELTYPGADSQGISLVQDGDYDGRIPAPPVLAGPAAGLTAPLQNVRAVLLLGKRNIRWEKREGLDSFRGDEDVRIGAEVEIAFARSIPGQDSDDDLYASMDLYAAAGPPSLFFATRLRADSRRDYDTGPGEHEMKDVTAEGEALLYIRPSFLPSHTVVLRAAGGRPARRTPRGVQPGGPLVHRVALPGRGGRRHLPVRRHRTDLAGRGALRHRLGVAGRGGRRDPDQLPRAREQHVPDRRGLPGGPGRRTRPAPADDRSRRVPRPDRTVPRSPDGAVQDGAHHRQPPPIPELT